MVLKIDAQVAMLQQVKPMLLRRFTMLQWFGHCNLLAQALQPKMAIKM